MRYIRLVRLCPTAPILLYLRVGNDLPEDLQFVVAETDDLSRSKLHLAPGRALALKGTAVDGESLEPVPACAASNSNAVGRMFICLNS